MYSGLAFGIKHLHMLKAFSCHSLLIDKLELLLPLVSNSLASVPMTK
jgi:hypothetical protein